MCTSPRRIGMHPRPGQPIHFVQIGLTAVVFAFALQALFPWVGLRGLVSFVPFWIAFETIYRAKVRGSVVCSKCGFDPFLYLVDVDQARAAIRDHWRIRFEEKGIPFPEEERGNRATRYQRSASKGAPRWVDPRKIGENSPSNSAAEEMFRPLD